MHYSTIKVKKFELHDFLTNHETKNVQVYASWKYMSNKLTKYIHMIGEFRTQSNIYDGAFLQKQSMVYSH